MGQTCPVPVVMTLKALQQAKAGDVVEVLVDNEIAVQNLMKMAKNRGCRCEAQKQEEKRFSVMITVAEQPEQVAKGDAENAAVEAEDNITCQPFSGVSIGIVVVIDGATMGRGNDELGKVLMKGFIYALSQQEPLPETMLFYNGGVMLTTEGSDSITDLKSMEALGVKIYSCGTCLDYYGRKDQLEVGEVTNMYDIVEKMMQAKKVVKP